MEKKAKGRYRGIITIIIVALIAIMILTSTIVTVNSGSVGLVSRLGALQDTVLLPGLHVVMPIVNSVEKVNIQTKKVEVDASAASKDMQVITTTVAVNYHIDTNSVVNLYKNVGRSYENTIISPAIQESLKSVTARFSAEQLITNRQEISMTIKQELSERVGPYGIVIENFNITNLDFSPEFNAAIEAKQTAQQQALKAEQDLLRVTIEAQQQVEQAKAEAEATKARADAEAYAIKAIQDQLAKSEAYLEYQKIEKWDGKLPVVQGENNAIIDLRDKEISTYEE